MSSQEMSQATTPSTPTTPGSGLAGKKRKQLGWAPPTLYIPPQGTYIPAASPHSATNISMHSSMSNNQIPPHMYHHNRASEFMFNQFSGIKDFTMSTAKSGLGIGEKSAFWCYNKLSSWSKKWFTHIFLSFVIVGYTVGGALMFQTIEGRNEEKIVEIDIRAKRQALIEELRNLSIYIPQERSVGEWHGVATAKLQTFEDYVIEAYKNHQLIVANHGPKIWTFWNAVVFCSTIYTTIGNGENDVDLSKIEAMVTPEQEHSASVARKRRTITRKRSTSGSKSRSKTPMRASRAETSSSEEDDDAPPAADRHCAERAPRNDNQKEENNVTHPELQTSKDITMEPTEDRTLEPDLQAVSEIETKQTEEPTRKPSSDEPERKKNEMQPIEVPKKKPVSDETQRRIRPKTNIEQNPELQRRSRPKPKASIDHDSSSQSQDEPVRRIRPKVNKYHQDEVLRRVKAKSLPRDEVPKNESSRIDKDREPNASKEYANEGVKRHSGDNFPKNKASRHDKSEGDTNIEAKEEMRRHQLREDVSRREAKEALKREAVGEVTKQTLNGTSSHKTKEASEPDDEIKKRDLKTKPKSATNSERQSTVSDSSSINMERRGSLPKNFEEKIQKLDRIVSNNTKEIMSLLHRAKTTVEEKGKELRRRRFHKTDQKRSQSTPKQLTEAEVMESFKKAQVATAEREKERIRSLSARRYSSGSEKSNSPEPKRPARKPYRPVVQELIKQKKSEKQLKNKIKSNKIIEILDPKTSKVIATKEMGQVAKIKFFDVFRILRQFGPRQIIREYSKYKKDMSEEYKQITNQRRRCINHLIILIIFCGLGGIIFKFTEGTFENFYKCGVKRVKRDFIDLLWIKSHNLREEEWKSLARNKLRVFEDELHTAHEAGIHSYSGQKSWSFLNGIVYCLTVVTTIGYGHLYPTTKTGQALTIVYSLIGIPLFLIILTDFGKLFTRCIKFLWSFVRRLYYTGSCKSMRRSTQAQGIFKGAQMVYELATFRRPSMFDPNMNKNVSPGDNSPEQNTTAPPTPAISNYEIDDEFNLPISVAILLLVLYILLGALLFGIWEGWDFFASFYFVFISMSTIGFGDYVPRHPIFMIVSIVYLVFGLALMSMCINVVQVKLSDTFNQASAKIGATIGLGVAPEDGTIKPVPPKSVEMPQVHGSINDINSIRSGELIGPNTSRV